MKNKVFNIFFYTLFISFLVVYFSSMSGYYEYTNNKKMTLTNKELKEYEKDIKSGKSIDTKKYLTNKSVNYSSGFSKFTSKLSNKISEITTNGINSGFKYLSKYVS